VRYLITGGSGFIGTHLAEHLLTRGDQVTVLDLRRPVHQAQGAYYIQGSVTDERLLEGTIPHHDAVFHLAATVGFANVMHDTVRTCLTSTIGSFEVFYFCSQHQKRILFTSTSACYGRACGRSVVRETDDGILGSPKTASWSYAYAKAADEALAFAYHRERQLPVIVARLFNTVGPYQSGEAGFVLPRFVQQALQHKPLQVHEPGTQTRTFCHVADTVRCLAKLMECDRAPGELVNVGGNQTVSMAELADRVIDLTASESRIELVDHGYGPGYDNVVDRRPDLAKLDRLIHDGPKIGLDAMITDVIFEHLPTGKAA
jgi:UDP-glucose 4-epimerase